VASKALRDQLAQRAAGLAHFVVGLAYYKSNDLLQAARWLEAGQAASVDDVKTQRLVLLFLGSTAARQNDLPAARYFFQRALDVDPTYARAELGRAQIGFLAAKDGCTPDKTDIQAIAEAIQGYQRALTLESQPFDEIRTKASLFLGHAYLCWSLATPEDQRADKEAQAAQAENAYQYVVERYRATGDPGVQYLAAAAWLGLGGMYADMSVQGADRDLVAQAATAYDQAATLSRQPIEQATAHLGLALVNVWRGECQAAQAELDATAAIYQKAVSANPKLSDQPYDAFRRAVDGEFQQVCPS
jgi:tetratricopeptide (TPR) repeat protein